MPHVKHEGLALRKCKVSHIIFILIIQVIIFSIYWIKENALLKLSSLALFYFNVATRNFKNIYVTHIIFSLDRASIENCLGLLFINSMNIHYSTTIFKALCVHKLPFVCVWRWGNLGFSKMGKYFFIIISYT